LRDWNFVVDPFVGVPAAHRRLARFALRDLRGGLAGLRVFLLCIALGVMAVSKAWRERPTTTTSGGRAA